MRFDRASAVTSGDLGKWKAEVQPDWDIFGVANGGYLMAIAARAMSQAAGGRSPVSLTAHFIRPVSSGPVEVSVETVKTGRTFSTMSGRVAAESDSMTLLGSFTEPGLLGDGTLYVDAAPPELPPPEQCPRALPSEDGPLPPPMMTHFEERIHPEDAGPLQGRPTGKAMMRGWFRLHDQEPIDPFALLMIADAFPPAVLTPNFPWPGHPPWR